MHFLGPLPIFAAAMIVVVMVTAILLAAEALSEELETTPLALLLPFRCVSDQGDPQLFTGSADQSWSIAERKPVSVKTASRLSSSASAASARRHQSSPFVPRPAIIVCIIPPQAPALDRARSGPLASPSEATGPAIEGAGGILKGLDHLKGAVSVRDLFAEPIHFVKT